jgi:signal transduction histidine kinase
VHPTLTEHLLDLVQNAMDAGATFVEVSVAEEEGTITVTVSDNGRGMTKAERQKALDPFQSGGRKHPARRVGLGLPFFLQMVEQVGGHFDLRSEPGVGTSILASYRADHPDAPPVGEWPEGVVQAMALSDQAEMVFRRTRGDRVFTIRRSELAEALGGLADAEALDLARGYVRERHEEFLGKG